MSPGSVSRANFSIDSGTVRGVTSLTIRVDPVERTVVMMPADALAPDTEYVLSIHPSDAPANRLSAYDGAPYEGPGSIRFRTAGATDKGEDEGPFDPAVDPCAAYDVLAGSCLGSSCHGGGDEDPTGLGRTPPAEGLSLMGKVQGGDSIQATAVGRAAVTVQAAADPGGAGNPVPRRFPYGMPIIEPGSSAGSYLMYKVLRRPPLGALPYLDPTVPDVADPGGALADDLNGRCPGAPMPHPTRRPEKTKKERLELHWAELVTLRAWIDQGAVGCNCVSGVDCNGDAGVDGGGDAAPDAPDAAEAGATDADAADGADAGG